MKGTPNTRGLPGIKKTKLISVIFAASYFASNCLDVASSFFLFLFFLLCMCVSFIFTSVSIFAKVPKECVTHIGIGTMHSIPIMPWH